MWWLTVSHTPHKTAHTSYRRRYSYIRKSGDFEPGRAIFEFNLITFHRRHSQASFIDCFVGKEEFSLPSWGVDRDALRVSQSARTLGLPYVPVQQDMSHF